MKSLRVFQIVAVTVVVVMACFARAQATDKNPPVAQSESEQSEALHRSGHLEVQSDPYVPIAREDQPTSPAFRGVRNGYVSVQVNVDENGDNIVGDAANEPSIAVDLGDPSHMAIGWRQFDTISSSFRQAGWGYTADGGQSWTFPGVIDPGVFRSDPVLDSDAEGNFYYNSLTNEGGYWCKVYKSTDGGATWDDGTYAFGGDKQWMTIDRTDGMGHGNIYASWNEFYSICDGHFTRSTDGGETFVGCTDIPSSPYWGTLAVGPDGELYVSGQGFIVAKSTTAQDPLQEPVEWDFATSVDLGGSIVFSAGPNPGGLLGQAWVAVDHSDGPSRGNVYLLCSVDPPGADPLEVMFSRSTDGGSTWTDPVRVNDDLVGNGAWQWFSTMSVAPNGRIDVTWNDTRNDLGGYDSELYYSYSEDAGLSWSVNEALSPAFDPHVGWPQQNKLGDYNDMVSDDAGAHVAYAATFNGEQDVYYLRIGDVCFDAGTVTLDRPKYACESTANLTVNDCGLNTDEEVAETVEITIDSNSEPDGESVLLVETGPDMGLFEGSIQLSESDSPGVLLIAEGDTVTAIYIDADDGEGGFDVEVTATAVVDCTAPIISNVETTEIEPRSAVVIFDTDEPALGSVHYGTSCEALTETAVGSGYSTSPTVDLTGLQDNTTYFYAVEAEDEAGNTATDDDGGLCYSFSTPEIPDFFTELFGNNDLDGLSLIFIPNESTDFYIGCVEEITELPTDPADGTVLTMSSADTFATVTLTGGATVWLYGVGYGTFYVGSNGYITFNSGDSEYSESLEDHFAQPRISALFDDLNPSSSGGGSVSWKQLSDRVAVTWENVPEYTATGSNTFQIEMYFDGTIVLSYSGLTAGDGLTGLSEGNGLSPDYYTTDLSAMGPCAALTIELPDGAPWRVDPEVPTTISVQIEDGGEIVVPGSETLHYRFDGGTFLTSPLAPLGGNFYEATLPAASCGDEPEFYFSATGNGGTTIYEPPDAPASVYSAIVATLTVILDDDFETDLGWTVEDIDVETGSWERGIPAGDGTGGDPLTDFDGSGQCYLTGNAPGNSDVDGGPTQLISPILDLSGASDTVFRHARWFTCDDDLPPAQDYLDVEVSNDDGASWTLIESISNTEGWVERTIDIADYVGLTSQVRVRFSVADNPNNSKTEVGIDALEVLHLACAPGVTGDFDEDGDVDLDDFARFTDCLAGPGATPDPPDPFGVEECLIAFDFDGDLDVDLGDFTRFQQNFGG